MEPTRKTDTFPVMGMHCAACAHNVERMLLGVDGVAAATVNLAAATVAVDYDPARATPEAMKAAVGRAGFGLITEDPDTAERQKAEAERRYRRSLSRRCMVAWCFTAPLMAVMLLAHTAWTGWLALALTLPLLVYSTLPFFTAAVRAARAGQTNMDTLVAVSTGIAFLFSLAGTLLPDVWTARGLTPPCYYEATAMITAFVLTGKVMEERAKHRTGEAIRALMGLQPRTARVVLPDGTEGTYVLDPGTYYFALGNGAHEALNNVLLAQGECAPAATEAALRAARDLGLYTVYNPAPARPVPDDLWTSIDLVCLNETECQIVCGVLPSDDKTCLEAARLLRAQGAGAVVITLGAAGSFGLGLDGAVLRIPAAQAPAVVDTTGAGDTYIGALVAGRVRGLSLEESMRWGAAASALTVSRLGAQQSIPTAAEVEASR